MSKIRPWLYVGSVLDAARVWAGVDHKEITHVLNVSYEWTNNPKRRLVSLLVPIEDCVPVPDWAIELSLVFSKYVAKNNGVLLVHCQMGISRSVAIAAAILCQQEAISYYDAIQDIKVKRDIANPHPMVKLSVAEYIDPDSNARWGAWWNYKEHWRKFHENG